MNFNRGTNWAKKTIEFAFYLFGISFLLSITLSEGSVLLISLCVIFLSFGAEERKDFFKSIRESKLILPFSLFIAFFAFSSFFGLDRQNSFSYLDSELLKILAFLALFAPLKFINGKKAQLSYALGALMTALLGIWQFASNNFFGAGEEIYRAHGKMHAVSYSETMAIAFLFTFIKFANSERGNRTFWGVLSAVTFSGFALGLSRGPFLGLIVSLAIVWFLNRPSRKPILLLFSLTFAAILAAGVFSGGFRNKMASIPRGVYQLLHPDKNIPELDRTSSGRIDMWRTGIKIIKDYPLAGAGPYNVPIIFHFYHPEPVDGRYDWSDVHNLYLQKTVEYGVPGGVAFVFLFFSFGALALRNYRKDKNDLTLWALAGMGGFYVMMLTDSSFHLPRVAFNVYFMLALSYASAGPWNKKRSVNSGFLTPLTGV